MLPGIIRTFVPMIVGWIISLPVIAAAGIDQAQLETLITTLISMAYYFIVRQLEKKYPQAGILLGYAQAPSYDQPTVSAGDGS